MTTTCECYCADIGTIIGNIYAEQKSDCTIPRCLIAYETCATPTAIFNSDFTETSSKYHWWPWVLAILLLVLIVITGFCIFRYKTKNSKYLIDLKKIKVENDGSTNCEIISIK